VQLTVLAKRAFPNFKTRLAIRRAAYLPLDVLDFVVGKRDPLIPPRGLWFVGGGSFADNQFLPHFISLCDLQPSHRVLDVGCGIGKQAVPLTRYLNSAGSYEGFDIVEAGVQWCQRHVTSRHPNFKFRHVDVFNKHYNPDGHVPPSVWKFPYPDQEFDFVFLISVFTHMLPDSVRNYINEIGRVLKPGAQCFVSFLLMNDDSRALIDQGKSSLSLTHDLDGYTVLDPKFPETTVGLPESLVKKCFEDSGLAIKTIHYGSWCGRKAADFYQDIVLSVRK
jgi:ubiquinone/menaquinone biosynthesis C-methylase UbiE